MTTVNQKIVLAEMPQGAVGPEHFSLEVEDLGPLEEGQVRIAVDYISIDAFIRTTLRDGSFHQSVGVGGTIGALGAGHVIDTGSEQFHVGDAVKGPVGAQTVATVPAQYLETVDESLAPLSAHLGALGLTTGLTAWVGVRDIGRPQPGETFVVSAAAGAVGSIAGQIARMDGARVIGIAGGPAKAAHLVDELGFDAAIDYKNDDVAARLRELAPDGVNVYFDNVGGELLDVVLDQMAERGRIVICGAISQYERTGDVRGPSLYLRLAERQCRMEGFAVFHFPESYAPATAELAGWLADGSIVMTEQVVKGIERFTEALETMFTGGNVGKLLVHIERQGEG